MAERGPPSRLERRVGLSGAVVLGLGAMLGAGIFGAVGPAAQAAGAWLLLGLVLAGAAAWCNARSTARLAARHPESGGAYVYGRERLGPLWGQLAGWGFVAGKLASCAAMALTFGAYALPGLARPLAAAAVLALAAVDYAGVTRTLALTRVLVAIVVAVLLLVVAVALLGEPDPARLAGSGEVGALGVLRSGGLLFFAFAGYARIATLGEEVIDPAATIPRAIVLALGIALALYAAVLTSALLAVGPARLAGAEAPLAEVVAAAGAPALAGVVRAGAAVACLGVLVSLVAGVSRTAFAMAAAGDLPGWLGAVHPRIKVPHHAVAAVGVVVAVAVLLADLRAALGFSSFCVLTYYAVANAAALTLPGRGRALPAAGLVLCAALALTLPAASVLAGLGVLAAGVLVIRRCGGG